MIASLTLFISLLVVGRAEWPALSFARVGLLTLVLGVANTIYSEWINVVVRKSWAYAPSMPVLPPLGTGLSPLLQWLIVPSLALYCARRALSAKVGS